MNLRRFGFGVAVVLILAPASPPPSPRVLRILAVASRRPSARGVGDRCHRGARAAGDFLLRSRGRQSVEDDGRRGGCGEGEQPLLSKEGVGPAVMVFSQRSSLSACCCGSTRGTRGPKRFSA